MATAQLSYSSSIFQCKRRSTECFSSSIPSSSVTFPHQTSSFACFSISYDAFPPYFPIRPRVSRVLAVAEEKISPLVENEVEEKNDDGASSSKEGQVKRCQLYVCNLPRSCDTPQLLEMFKSYGSVQSAEISTNTETGISKGCGYVTMSSVAEAIAAVTALDKSDVGGREMRVKFSEDMNSKKNIQVLNSTTKKNLVFETPHKIYVGNLPWSVKPEFLREYFSQFGNVVSVRVLFDRKEGKNRVYGFLSFSLDEELKAAMSSNGTELLGRKVVVRNALKGAES